MSKENSHSKSRREFLNRGITVGAAAVGASVFGAPAIHASKKTHSKIHKWKMVTTWPKNFPGLGTGANDLAKRIETLSDRRIRVKVYGAGELVPAFGTFDAVSRGTVQMGHGAAYYWKGKHEATQFFAAVPFGLNANEMNAWIDFGGGQKLWDDLYAPFGLKPFNAGNTGVQMGGWFQKEINKVADFKGLKIRMPGLGGEVLRRMGSTVVALPGGEIFQALKTNAIDASEWVGPYNDLAFGFYKAAKYYYWPGWHEPGTAIEAIVNRKAFEALPKDLKAIVETACRASCHHMMSEATMRNADALQTLVSKHKVTLKRFPDPVLKKLGAVSRDVVNEVGKKDPASKKVLASFESFFKKARRWDEVSEQGYSLARKLTR